MKKPTGTKPQKEESTERDKTGKETQKKMERNTSAHYLTDEEHETYDKGWQIGTFHRGPRLPQQETPPTETETKKERSCQ